LILDGKFQEKYISAAVVKQGPLDKLDSEDLKKEHILFLVSDLTSKGSWSFISSSHIIFKCYDSYFIRSNFVPYGTCFNRGEIHYIGWKSERS
jgi:hypothetical protein